MSKGGGRGGRQYTSRQLFELFGGKGSVPRTGDDAKSFRAALRGAGIEWRCAVVHMNRAESAILEADFPKFSQNYEQAFKYFDSHFEKVERCNKIRMKYVKETKDRRRSFRPYNPRRK